MYIDSHCHLNDDIFPNKELYIKEAKDAGVNVLTVIGYDLLSSKKAVELAIKYENVYAIIGISPQEVKNADDNDLKEIDKLLANSKVIGVGEIGLDYYYDKDEATKIIQIKYFIEQISLANKHHLPISIHCRDAFEDTYKILKEHHVKFKGVLHCYSGSLEMAKMFTNLGYVLGFGGTVTFKNAVRVKEVIKYLDANSYVLETDAPYLTPSPHRGELNSSKYIPLIASEIALLRGEDISLIEKQSTENFKRIFKI